ncbi:ferredoxin [Amycolatopsis sp. NPDC049691]|uniref:ferredoxin n=1 Tax=Amycolatopsis sp. NPDC049691 TaxID=3155155 RepID=UPI003430D549
MEIELDRAKCTGLGICESLAPDVFEVDESGELAVMSWTVPQGQEADVEAAVAGCPTEALKLRP